jgi:DDE superfamily endonuclease
MFALPREAALLLAFRPAFTRPTFERFLLLAVGTIVAMGRRTVSRVLWPVRSLLRGHPSSYHRFFSARRWSPWPLGKVLAAAVLEWVPPEQPVLVAVDDTVVGHRGKRVYAAGCHRDAVRSNTSGRVVTKWGHRWVVLAVLVRFPFSSRPWALPVLAALWRDADLDQREQRRHRTPVRLTMGLVSALMHWFPRRHLILLGDGSFSSHELARFCRRHRRRLTLIARCDEDVNLYAVPGSFNPGYHKTHRLPRPWQVAAGSAAPWRAEVAWYGNSRREVRMLSGCGGWYSTRSRGHESVVPIRWVFVRDARRDAKGQTKGGREDYFYCTDLSLRPEKIVECFAGRWSIEVTFEEARAHLGFEGTRCRRCASVLRQCPCLLGAFSVVSLVYAELVRRRRGRAPVRQMPCYAKAEPTFSDALFAVRRLLWVPLLQQAAPAWGVAPLPRRLRQMLLDGLCQAA